MFSDGVLTEDRSGTGYVIYRGLRQEIWRGLLLLGNSAEVYDAEIAGAIEGLAAALRNPLAFYASNITVFLEKQEAAIRLLSDVPTAPSSTKFFLSRKLAVSYKRRSHAQNTMPGEVAICWEMLRG